MKKQKYKINPGQRFGILTVIEKSESVFYKHGEHKRFKVKCDCGNIIISHAENLRRGKSQSCGKCVAIQKIKERNSTHGLSKTRIWRIWTQLRQRCNSVEDKDYGGRGIKYCYEWREFNPFYKWAMANGYKDNLTIDRINNDGDYNPSNCRWVDKITQNNNTRRSRKYSYEGQLLSIPEICRKVNLKKKSASHVWKRIHRHGLSLEDALIEQRDYEANAKCTGIK